MPTFLAIMLSILAVSAAVLIVAFVMVPLFKGIGWLIRHIVAFIGGMLYSFLRVIGAILTCIVFVPLILVNVVIGRWSAASHFGRGVQDEVRAMGQNTYRFFVGHPARLLMLTPLVEGLERRVPDAVAHAPTRDTPRRRTGQFDGYKVVGSLKSGGSGGRLYIAEPDETKQAVFARRGLRVDQVVIKVFSQSDGASLPQIVRESKSLEAAKNLGLILEHELNDQRFYYAMRYVPGDMLSVVTNRMHDRAGPGGLDETGLREAIGYAADLSGTLETYHSGGLWHKDVKPDNIIISSGVAHLVDFGLVTPLRSAMTLTTHGTEYFRDPEMVRLALKGVRVSDVNGAKFDVYAAGAVLYSVIERSFPAHGGLSQITKKCPEAVRWIVRRAMAEYDARYASAAEMLADLQFVRGAADIFAVRPADLPSMRVVPGQAPYEPAPQPEPMRPRVEHAAYAGSPVPPREAPAQQAHGPFEAAAHAAAVAMDQAGQAMRDAGFAGMGDAMRARAASLRARPRIRVTDWWKGGYVVVDVAQALGLGGANPGAGAGPSPSPSPAPFARAERVQHAGARRSASEQLESARRRVEERRARAALRMRRGVRAAAQSNSYSNKPNSGVAIAVGGMIFVVTMIVMFGGKNRRDRSIEISRDVDEGSAFVIDGDSVREVVSAAHEGVREGLAGAADGIKSALVGASEGLRDAAKETKAAALREARRIERGERAYVGEHDSESESESESIGGRWLILDDVGGALDEGSTASMDGAMDRLLRAECELTGVGGKDDEDELETLARARSALGAATRADDEGAIARLRAWLESGDTGGGEGFDGVIWFARTDAPGAYAVAVVSRQDIDAGPVARALADRARSER